ncbi:MAG: HEAT repeat domain-containing protein [Archangium sp.]|nr:HEAT repeat domain-containing protein [Archangium sp.]MDP3570210.1 HEAT repeat domain-containing protein [Archangium sp.]
MRPLLAFALVLLASSALAQSRVSRCWAACERNVADPRQRATACGACLTAPDRADAWLSRLAAPPPGLLADPDWEVRWAALLFDARKVKGTAAHQLALWLARAKGEEATRACLTAVHAASAFQQSLAALLSADPRAAQTCLAQENVLREALWVELYSPSAPTRREALTALARAFERSPARVVLDALPSHAPDFDALVLDTLASWSVEANIAPAASLMAAATPKDVETMNRVLAVYARKRDAAKPLLASPQEAVRREGMGVLAELAPLSEAELLGALADPVYSLRMHAAYSLARGETRSVAAMAGARLSGLKPATLAQQRVLLELVADKHEADCAPIVLETWRDLARPPELRARALAVAASCDWEAAREDVEAAFTAPPAFDRAAAVAALGFFPRSEPLTERLLRASEAPEPALRSAACRAIGRSGWRGGVARLVVMTADESAEVRTDALSALVALDAPAVEAKLSAALEKDASPQVRATAAGLLVRFTSPRAISALSHASKNDTDANVKLVAAQSLRKLAPGSPSP